MLSPPTPLIHHLLLAAAFIGWALAIGGLVGPHYLVSDAMGPRSIMSRRTFTQLAVVSVALLLAMVVAVSAIALMVFSDQPSSSLTWAAVISGVQLLPFVLLLGAAGLK